MRKLHNVILTFLVLCLVHNPQMFVWFFDGISILFLAMRGFLNTNNIQGTRKIISAVLSALGGGLLRAILIGCYPSFITTPELWLAASLGIICAVMLNSKISISSSWYQVIDKTITLYSNSSFVVSAIYSASNNLPIGVSIFATILVCFGGGIVSRFLNKDKDWLMINMCDLALCFCLSLLTLGLKALHIELTTSYVIIILLNLIVNNITKRG